MPEEIESPSKVGSVSANRYARDRGRTAEAGGDRQPVSSSRSATTRWRSSRCASRGGLGAEPRSCSRSGTRCSAWPRTSACPTRTVEGARWTASKWPKDHRAAGVSFTIHRILAGIADDAGAVRRDPHPARGQVPVDAGRRQPPGRPPGRQAGHPPGEDQRDPHARPGRGGRRGGHRRPAAAPVGGRAGQGRGQGPGGGRADPRGPGRRGGRPGLPAAPGRRRPASPRRTRSGPSRSSPATSTSRPR